MLRLFERENKGARIARIARPPLLSGCSVVTPRSVASFMFGQRKWGLFRYGQRPTVRQAKVEVRNRRLTAQNGTQHVHLILPYLLDLSGRVKTGLETGS